jgi:hypothetical protein
MRPPTVNAFLLWAVLLEIQKPSEAISQKGFEALFAGTYDAKARSDSRNHKLNHNNSSNIELVADVRTSRQGGWARYARTISAHT